MNPPFRLNEREPVETPHTRQPEAFRQSSTPNFVSRSREVAAPKGTPSFRAAPFGGKSRDSTPTCVGTRCRNAYGCGHWKVAQVSSRWVSPPSRPHLNGRRFSHEPSSKQQAEPSVSTVQSALAQSLPEPCDVPPELSHAASVASEQEPSVAQHATVSTVQSSPAQRLSAPRKFPPASVHSRRRSPSRQL